MQNSYVLTAMDEQNCQQPLPQYVVHKACSLRIAIDVTRRQSKEKATDLVWPCYKNGGKTIDIKSKRSIHTHEGKGPYT